MNNQQLNITMGTDIVLHDTLTFDGEVFDPNLSTEIAVNLISGLGKRTPLDVEVVDEELVIDLPWEDGRLPGCYSLEVTGTCNGKKWASVAQSIIRYTKATVPGASEVTVDSDTYDISQVVAYRYSDSPLDEVDATIDDNYGEPSVTPTYEHNKLTLDFKNMRGNGIASVEQTVESTVPEGINETTITQDNGTQTVMRVRNGKSIVGPKGETGDSAIFDPSTGNISAMKQTTGDDVNSPMSQKAVTDEFNTFIAEVLPAPAWYNGTVTTAGYGSSSTEKYLAELSFDDDIAKVVFATQSNESKFYIYSVRKVDGTDVFALESGSTAFTHPSSFALTPETGKRYIVRLGKDAVSRGSWTQAAKPKITQYYNSYTHQIDENTARIAAIEEGVMTSSETLKYKYGQIDSSGYDLTNKGNKITDELTFDPSKVSEIKVTLPESGAQYAVYTIVGSTIAIAEGLNGYVTSDFSFTPVVGTKYVVRFRAVAGASQNYMDALPISCYPKIVVSYVSPSQLFDDIKSRVAALEENAYGYKRTYSNITGLLTFEGKAISTSGIVDNQSALLAKTPSIGCVEVKMNRPTGHFSVWKKNGNTITCLQESTHYQYRYTGDYTSEYYVMLQAETGETLNAAIASVYTYSDEGATYATAADAPTWAKGKKLAFFGDSIVQGRYPKNDSSVNICMDKPWSNLVAEALGSEDYMNFGIGGALVYDSDWKSLARNASLITDYDVVFVCAGTNDYGNKTSQANFESAFTSVITTLKANNTKVVVLTPTHRTKAISSPAMSFSQYCASEIAIAETANVSFIQLHSLTNTSDFISHLVDELHPDEVGHQMIANIVLREIKSLQ